MRKSIKIMVGIRIAVALIAVLLFSCMILKNIDQIKESEITATQANELLSRAQKAEAAHYKWSNNLSNALYANAEFTGSIDPTSCILGQWIYGDAGMDDDAVLKLRKELEPLHKELHESATYVLNLLKTDANAAHEYYQNTILTNLTKLVGMLDKVVERATELSEASNQDTQDTISTMKNTAIGGFILTLVCMISLIVYVLRQIVRPILHITGKSRPLQEGHLTLEMNYKANNELGDLALTLEQSMGQIRRYVEDINRVMAQLSKGNFNVHTSMEFDGDFKSIEESIDSFTNKMSETMGLITQAENKVSANAGQLSNSAQALAQGATQQASAVEQLSSTLEGLSKSARQNVQMASDAQNHAQLAGEQVTISSQQMEQMVTAMEDITNASQKIEKIISTIEDIALQTNILALNAAVEAASAGTAGKGFAVVSSEVRSLAIRSDEAAKATKELIENSVQAAEKGSDIVGEVSQTLQKTLDLVMQSNNDIGRISNAVECEAESISQVSEGINQISAVVQTNSASSQQSAAVSAELFEQVRLLQDQTDKFVLKR